MGKIAMSFTTSGAVNDTFHLAASVLLMVAEALGATTVSADASKGLMSSAATTMKSRIDSIFTKNSWSTLKAVKKSPNKLAAYFTGNATKTSSTLTGSSTSGSGISGTALKALLEGTATAYQLQWAACMGAIIPYVNYKLSLMTESDYKMLCNAVISSGGFSAYSQTNSAIQ